MSTWPAKDPDAVKDYLYTIPLDAGDAVATHSFTKLMGEVILDSESRDGAVLTAWLSGGTDGETAVFRIAWTTAGGRTDDDIITIAVVSNTPVAATPYGTPRAADLIALYPAFVAVSPATIEAWISRVIGSDVDTSWSEASYRPAVIAAAAHRMALNGTLGAAMGQAAAFAAAGVTGFKSGTVDITLDAGAVARISAGGWTATAYGRDYLDLLAKRGHSFGVTNVGCGCA